MSATPYRSPVKLISFCALTYAIFRLASAGAQTEGDPTSRPYSRIGQDIIGDAVANGAFHSRSPLLIIAGATYKMADLANDIGAAALDHQDHSIGAEILLADENARQLKEIKATGGDLNGVEATAIKQRLHDHIFTMTSAQGSPVGYTAAAIIANLPYAVKSVSSDKIVEQTIDLTLNKLGVFRLLENYLAIPEKVNWMLNYGGPAEEFERGLGWGKLGTRARAAERAASAAIKAIKDQQEAFVASELRSDRTENTRKLAANAFTEIYTDIMTKHRSEPRTVQVESFRQAVAESANLTATAGADPVVRSIQADDSLGWQRYANPVSPQRRTFQSPAAPAPVQMQQSAMPAWRIEYHQALQNYGTNWDGRRNR
jgi:hypothetical protein